jgi:cupin 2 domain-containing protein
MTTTHGGRARRPGRRLPLPSAPPPSNLFADLPRRLGTEQFDVLVASGRTRLERIISTAHATPAGRWDKQTTNEWVVVLRGSAGLRFEGTDAVTVLREGDHLVIPAQLRHRVEWTDVSQPTVWLALHFPPRR